MNEAESNNEMWIDPVGCRVYFEKPQLYPDYSFKVISEKKVKEAWNKTKLLLNDYAIEQFEKELGIK